MELKLNSGKDARKPRLHFNLKQTRDKEKRTQIMLAATVNGKRMRVYTKLRVEPKYWDSSTGLCRWEPTLNLRERTRLKQINNRIRQMQQSVYQLDERLAEKGEYLSARLVRSVIEKKIPTEETVQSPVAYLYHLIDDYMQTVNRRGKKGIVSTKNTYTTAVKRLENFCIERNLAIHTFEDFDKAFFQSFSNYLYTCTYSRGNKSQKYTQNTVVNTLKVIKNLLHRAYDNDMTDNNYFSKVQTILSSDASEKIYLEETEIKKLARLELEDIHEKAIRDMFIIGCYTALRISDIQNLDNAVISNGIITLYQIKTKEQVQIPILKEISPLLMHYQKRGFPKIQACRANKVIKELAKRCGIADKISFKEQRGGQTVIMTKHKWEMVSFHTARRSCITNLYKRGYPVNYIMTLSGHRSIQAFQRYMRASSKELMSSFVDMLKKERAL